MSELVDKSEVLDIWNNYWITDMTTLDVKDQLRELATVELESAPQLNENQQKWINRLTINYAWYGGTAQHALHATLQEPEMPDLPQNEFAQVLEVFSKWVQEQEAE